MEYRRDADSLCFDRQIGENYHFTLSAASIARERTGVHATIGIALNDVELFWGRINVDKDEERVRATGSVFKMIPAESRSNGLLEYPQDHLKKDLNDFCRGLWVAKIEELQPEEFFGAIEREPPSFLLKPYILTEGGTIVFGPPGRGKSYIMLLLAVCLDAGLQVPWEVPCRRKVLIINLERSAWSMGQRLGNVNRVLGLPANRSLHVLNARGRSLEDVLPSVRRYVERHGIDVLFLDSLSRAGLGDMNDNESVNKIVDRLNSFKSWLALGHTPRADTTHVFGSQMFDAAADLTVRLTSQQDESEGDIPGPLGVGLLLDKRNDVAKQRMKILALEFDEQGLKYLRPANRKEFPEIEAESPITMRQVVADYILDQDDRVADATSIAAALKFNRTNVSRLLSEDERHFVFVRKDGKKSLYGVVKFQPRATRPELFATHPGAL